MGVAGAALLYTCTPGASGIGALPYLWFLPNPFFRGPAAVSAPPTAGATSSPGATTPDAPKATPAPSQSQRGGFGSTGSGSGSTGSS